VLPDFLTKMVEQLMTDPFPDAVIPQIRYYHDKDKIWNCGGRLFFGFRKYYYSGKSYRKLPAKRYLRITFATGCALLFNPDIIGLLTERFFFGEEDIDFSYRLMKQNKRMICALDAVIYHKVGQSFNSCSKNVNKGAIFIYYLNRFVNMKIQFNNLLIWNIWRFIYSFYIFYLLSKNFSFRELNRFMRLLWIKSSLLTEVSKQEFDKAITGFSKL
jgi:GT2 family glycosyltransferase